MRTTIIAACTVIGLFVLLLASLSSFAEIKPIGEGKALLERGKYFVTLGGCNDCHSPKEMTSKGPALDEARILSGHPSGEKLPEIPSNLLGPDKWGAMVNNNFTGWVGPWGTSYASNLTPDRETGLGNVNEELFVRILRTGKFMGGTRDILPPMPWQEIRMLTDIDLKALFVYLKSLKAVRNQVPASLPSEPTQ